MHDDHTPAPEYLRIPSACARYGLSRAGVYRLAGDGAIRLVKLGSTTLIDGDSLRQHMHSLPVARIRPQRPAQRIANTNPRK